MGSVIKVLLLIVFAAVVVAAAAVTKVARLQRRLAATPRVVYQTVLTECVDDGIPAARRAGGIPMDGMDRIPSAGGAHHIELRAVGGEAMHASPMTKATTQATPKVMVVGAVATAEVAEGGRGAVVAAVAAVEAEVETEVESDVTPPRSGVALCSPPTYASPPSGQ